LKEINKNIVNKWINDPSFINWAKKESKENTLKWELYFNEYPELWETAKAAKLLVEGISFADITKNKINANQSLKTLISRIDSAKRQQPINKSASEVNKNKTRRTTQIVFAMALVCLLMGFLIFSKIIYNPQVIVKTAFGEQKEVLLNDGSKVTLNANSTLKYTFKNPCKIQLDGEAFFEVASRKKTKEKFEVLTEDITVKVYGTSFNVNTRNEQTNIYLEEGKVELNTDDFENAVIQMEPGDLVSYSNAKQELKAHKKKVSKIENISWKDGTLIFNNTLLPKALYDIEDIYGIQFVLQYQELSNEKITGGVPIGDLNITIETLSSIYGLEISNKGKRYFLTKPK